MNDHATLGYVAAPPSGPGRAVLVIHSWWGLTRSFTAFADDLAARGYLVGCADLYRGATAATRTEARALRAAKRREPAYRALQRGIEALARHPASATQDPALVGFSMGGHWAVWLAQHPPPRIAGAVLYYAARGGDFANAHSPILAHFAAVDEFVSAPARRTMERAIARRGLDYAAYDYPDTAHWFAEAAHPSFDGPAARLAFERTVSFLDGLAVR